MSDSGGNSAGIPRVQAVVVSHQSRGTLGRCLQSLALSKGAQLEVTLVDNASSDGCAELARATDPRVRVIANKENLGFARACNQGWRAGDAPFVLFLNPDAEVAEGAVAMLAELASRPGVGIVGPLTLNEDGSVQVSTGPDLAPIAELRQRRLVRAVARRRTWALAHAAGIHAREHEPDWVSGSCLLARREALAAAGGFDEGFFLYEEDADLCRRVRAAGWRILFTPAAAARHQLGHSAGANRERARIEYHRSHLRYYRKHNGLLSRLVLRLALLGRAAALGIAGLAASRAALREARALVRLGLAGR